MSLDIALPKISAATRGTATEVGSTDVWLSPGRFAVFLALLILATFPAVLLGSQTFVFRDYGLFGYPLAFFHRESFWRGELPLWNPLSHCGVPFLAQWNTMVLYPPSLIYLLLPLPWSLSFFCLAHLFWGGIGMYFLAGNWSGHRLAGALAGVVFAFNGVMLSSLVWPSQIATFSWMPWVIWLAQRGWRQGGRQWIWGVAAGAMQMLTGGPETIVMTWLVVFVLAVVDLVRLKNDRKRIVFYFGGTVLLIGVICAAQLLPFLQLLRGSQRDAGFSSAMTGSLPTWGWANFLVPLFGTTCSSWGVYFQEGQQWIASYYVGVGTLFLGAIAIGRGRGWRAVCLMIAAAGAFFLAQGEHNALYRELLARIPAVGFARYPVKWVILVSAIAPLLAALGLTAWDQKPQQLKRAGLVYGAWFFVLIGVVLILNSPSKETAWPVIAQNGLFRAAFLAGIVLVLVQYPKSAGRWQNLLGLSLLVLFWADFLTHMPSTNPTAGQFVYSPDAVKAGRNWTSAPQTGTSRAMVSPAAQQHFYEHALSDVQNNYLLYRLGLFMNCNLLEGIPQVQGFFALTPREINLLTAAPLVWTNENFSALFDFVGVTQISSTAKHFEWEARSTAMPLVTVGQKAVFTDERTALGAFAQTNVDLRKVVFLPKEAHDGITATNETTARILQANVSNHRVSVEALMPEQTMLVIAQTYYPAWKAYIDGHPAKIWRANYAFQALQVPEGHHRIDLRYEDKVFATGSILSGLGIAVCTLLWAASYRRRNYC
jgi:hypothetical protein